VKLRAHRGMTILELMIVLAIIGGASFLLRSGFRMITRADLVEDSTEIAATLRRVSTLAVEHGQLHRVTFDLDKQLYSVEVCQGEISVQKNESMVVDAENKQRSLDKGRDKLIGLPTDMTTSTDPEEGVRRALAVVGQHIADRTCVPVSDSVTGDSTTSKWIRAPKVKKGIKIKEIWVQHRDDSVTKGQVAVYFFPDGESEKAVIEVTDGSDVFSVLVFGLTGRVELRDGALRDVNDHMMRNAMGDKDAKREDSAP